MTALRHYKNPVYDSARWAGFRFRDGDIVISTPPKCGTTWMQTLCAMLVLDSVTFDRRLEEISPWLDMQNKTLASVVASLEAQQHRRIIKTHTPIDGLPYDERVTYVCVGRDPRDVALSFEHHMANLDMDAFMPPGPPPSGWRTSPSSDRSPDRRHPIPWNGSGPGRTPSPGP